MNNDLSTITKLIDTLSKEQLPELNQIIIDVLKARRATELAQASTNFKIGDIVSFVKDDTKFIGVVFKISSKSIQVITSESMSVKVPPTYLSHEKNPSKKVLKLRDELFPTAKMIKQIFSKFIK